MSASGSACDVAGCVAAPYLAGKCAIHSKLCREAYTRHCATCSKKIAAGQWARPIANGVVCFPTCTKARKR